MAATNKPIFLKGIVEGFYGRPWSFDTRMAYAKALPLMGLDSYLYCPKSDPYLRKKWHQAWPAQEFAQLKSLSAAYKEQSLVFGVGLSPFALYLNYGSSQRLLLEQKINEINRLDIPLLAILFDDMPGDMDGLASRQCEIVQDIVSWTSASRVLVCPTYYSYDPLLEAYFGRMPQGYWPQLGRELASDVDVLWTGNQVCSDSVSAVDLKEVRALLQRNVVLWDNYPVNDGVVRSNFLYGQKLAQRDKELRQVLAGHLCNPMNQGLVSLRALSGLSELYDVGSGDDDWLQHIWGRAFYTQFLSDIANFENLGLEGLGHQRCNTIAQTYSSISGPAAREVVEWLRGEYAFDPACLTG